MAAVTKATSIRNFITGLPAGDSRITNGQQRVSRDRAVSEKGFVEIVHFSPSLFLYQKTT